MEREQLELLESFFRAYFRRLSYIYFERWESLIDYLGNVITFYLIVTMYSDKMD